jgi:hypothetical protein
MVLHFLTIALENQQFPIRHSWEVVQELS